MVVFIWRYFVFLFEYRCKFVDSLSCIRYSFKNFRLMKNFLFLFFNVFLYVIVNVDNVISYIILCVRLLKLFYCFFFVLRVMEGSFIVKWSIVIYFLLWLWMLYLNWILKLMVYEIIISFVGFFELFFF